MVILEKKVDGLSAQTLARFVLRARGIAGLRDRVNVLVTSDARMRSLNLQFRGRDKPTDVLSFPAERTKAWLPGRSPVAGEIAISAEIAAQNASRLGHPAALEVKLLALHGILHLKGLDHERDNGEMARKEAQLRRKLRLPVSLIERSESGTKKFARTRRSPTTRLRRA